MGAADWDAQWRVEPMDPRAPELEQRTPRWHAQERIVRVRLGGFEGLHAVELGAGRGLNALLYALRGAHVTLVDTSRLVLDQARAIFDAQGLEPKLVEADVLDLPQELAGRFDVSMSFGLCEHFVGETRRAIVAAHLDVVRPGGIAFVGVPNRLSPVYRLWMATLKARGTWPLGTEEPFTVTEVAGLARAAGGVPLAPGYGSFAATLVAHGANQVLYKLGRHGLPVPQLRIPLLDRFAYELLVPIVRRG